MPLSMVPLLLVVMVPKPLLLTLGKLLKLPIKNRLLQPQLLVHLSLLLHISLTYMGNL